MGRRTTRLLAPATVIFIFIAGTGDVVERTQPGAGPKRLLAGVQLALEAEADSLIDVVGDRLG